MDGVRGDIGNSESTISIESLWYICDVHYQWNDHKTIGILVVLADGVY